MPTTMVAGMFATFVLSLDHLGLRWTPAAVMPSSLILASFLMLCTVRIPKLKRQKGLLQVAQVAALATLAALAFLQILPEVPLVLAAGYLLFGAITGTRAKPPAKPPLEPV